MMEITTEHRQEAKLAAAKGAMSEKAAARLREIGEDEKQRKAANRVSIRSSQN